MREYDGDFLCLFCGGLSLVLALIAFVFGACFDLVMCGFLASIVFCAFSAVFFLSAYIYKCDELNEVCDKTSEIDKRHRKVIEVEEYYTNIFKAG